MVFSSVTFLCVFLPALIFTYYVCSPRHRNAVVLAASLVFYAWGAPQFLFALVASCGLDYWASRYLGNDPRAVHERRVLCAALAANLMMLIYFKYMGFFVEQVDMMVRSFGGGAVAWPRIIMPIGISFFTFQKISYLVDVYRRDAERARSFSHYLLYVSLFPQLIAGPIVRYRDISLQLCQRVYSDERFLSGAARFSCGLAKKVIVADTLAAVSDLAFGATAATAVDPWTLSSAAAWTAALCYAMQLYFDFSGYSDMAIGLGRMLGFDFLENFRHPYVSQSIGEFWRRWHISLSTWMREYLYIPLGGNRVSEVRVYGNLIVVFLLSGFWHGASWNFAVWGLLHGLFHSGERWARGRGWTPLPAVVGVPRTFLLVLVAWIFFRAWDLSQAVQFLSVMFTGWGRVDWDLVRVTDVAAPHALWMLVAASLLSTFPLWSAAFRLPVVATTRDAPDGPGLGFLLARGVATTFLLLASFVGIASSGFHPFIYFRF